MQKKITDKLEAAGICSAIDIKELGEEKYAEELKKFISSFDFMRLGQAISTGKWQTATNLAAQIEEEAKTLKIKGLTEQLKKIRICCLKKEKETAKQILAAITIKRTQIRKITNSEIN